MENMLTKRQKEILKIIIEEYTLTAQPVGSQILISKYLTNLSSATIRNDMVILEDKGYISKYYSSSGRIPTLQGYKFYNSNIDLNIHQIFKEKLKDILSKRNLSIDNIVNESVQIINEMTNLPTIVTEIYKNDLLRKIELVSISNSVCLFIIITSSGKILKEEINFDHGSNIDDLIVCVNIFNDRLIDTPISEIESKLEIIKNLIKSKVKSYEFVIQEIVEKIFKNIDWTHTSIKNSKEITLHPEYTDIKQFQKILNLLNDVTIWKQIAYTHSKTGQSSIAFNNDIGIDDSSIASTIIKLGNVSREISVIGPNRLTYAKVNSLLKVLKEELEKMYKNEK